MTTGNQIARSGARPGRSVVATDSLLFEEERSNYPWRLVDVLQGALERLIPFGYEDETGFHYGAMPGAKHFD